MLKKKKALVTGVSAGIGLAIAEGLLEAGCEVVGIARREERLKELANQYPHFKGIAVDLTKDLTAIKSWVEKNPVDILINNAGLALGRESLENTPKEAWAQMINTNVKAVLELTQICLPGMIERKSGDIVNLGSIAGMTAYAGGAVYCSTKAFIVQLTDALRLDLLGKNIRVIGIHPGMVETEFSEVRFHGDKQKAKEVYQGMNALSAKDIADAVVWSLMRPAHVNIQSMLIMPTDQGGAGAIYRGRDREQAK